MKQAWALLVVLGLAACEPTVPDSGAGVGFDDYSDYELERARREAALRGSGSTAFAPPPRVGTGPINRSQVIASSELAQAGIGQAGIGHGGAGATAGAAPGLSATGAVATDPGAPLSALRPQAIATVDPATFGNNPALSDEQDFTAVAGRQTIESDAERRAAQAETLVVVEPVPLPTQRPDTGPDIVSYALNAPNVKGQEWYSRTILSGQSRFERNCAGYNTPDAAQRDFLLQGGPERDPRGLDPDGDGLACGWDPAPFKLAAGN